MTQPKHARFHAVLFDLDGTLVDTAPDLAAAINQIRSQQGLPSLPLEHLRPHASHGARGLIAAGFDIGSDHPRYESLRRQFLEHYANTLCVQSKLFDGIPQLLEELDKRNIKWGVVTNKFMRLTVPILSQLGIAQRTQCIVAGDSVGYAKPHPAPLLAALHALNIDSSQCVYLGDAERDVQAAHAAHMSAVIARYGYIAADERPELWGADGEIGSPIELLDWIADDFQVG